MTPERQILDDMLDQLDRIARGVAEDLDVLGTPPTTVIEFEAMPRTARSASKALLKGFEQNVDTLQRVMRTERRATGYRLKGMTPFDVANKAEELDQVEKAVIFLNPIKLRNERADEYPDDPETRFSRFSASLAGFAFLDDAAVRVRRFAQTRIPEFDHD